MDHLVLGMTVLVWLIMIGVMTRMIFGGRRATSHTDMDEINRLLARFDELDAQAEPRVNGSKGFRNRSDATNVADGALSADEWPPRLR